MIMVTMKQWNDLRDIANRLADAGAEYLADDSGGNYDELTDTIDEYNAKYSR